MTLPGRRAPLTPLLLPGLLALFALYLVIPQSTASAQQASQEDTCPGADSAPTPTVVEVGAVPIVVESTTDEYFVLYVRHDLDAGTTFEVPVGVTLGQDGATTLTESLEALPKERYRVEKYLVSDPADVDGDCTDDITELADPVGMNPVNPVPTMSFDDGAAAIPNRETYVSLAYKGEIGAIDRHLAGWEAVKFHMVDMNTDRPSVYFMNTKTYQRHDDFQAAVGLEVDPLHGHETMVGEMVYHPKAVAPDGSLGVYRFQFGANGVYSFKEISYAFTVLAASMPLLEDNLAYYPMWSKAVPRYHKDKSLYDDSRVDVLLAEDIAFDLDFISLNRGRGFGFLRAMSLGERPNPRDIVIYDALPNELPRVAGIITTVPQTPLSHVNLRAVQDGVPNAFIRDALEAPNVEDLIGSYVQYLVGSTTYYVFAASPSEVDAHYADSRPSEPQTPERDLTVTEITPLSDIEFDDWDAFGVKAANVAVLGTLDFPENTVPDGYAVPFYFYDEFMKHNGFYDDVKELLADPNFQSDFDTQEKELKKLRKKIKKGETPEWMTGALEEMHAGFPADTSLRYRSSTNNEDLPGFSGAGLYDSKTQHPDETEEDGIAKSLKQVYASLWNFRAFTEREFYRVDHLAAAMGVLVHPNYSDELANGVAVSFDPIRMRYGNYYVNSQLGEDLVTNPDAHSAPEEILLHQGGEYTVLATSNQVEQGQLLMSDAQMDQLRHHLELIHDEFAELYGVEADEPFAMEIEFKITSDDILSIKQARPWVFGDDAPSENSPATGAPTISGTAQVDETLTADTSGITDADGLTNVSYSYQWIANDGTTDTDIENATAATYTLVTADEGKTIKVRMSFTDDRGYEETLTSAATATVAGRPNAPATGAPTISGTAQVGETLTADTSGITDADGLTNVSYSYQWIANDGTTDTDIENATAATYTLVTADEGKTIKVRVGFTDDANNEETLTSAPTEAVEAKPNSPATGAPTISGTAQLGETLTADVSGITDADGLTDVSYIYQWIANDGTTDTDISGQTGSTYTLVSADGGKTIKVRVGFTDDANNSETLTSEATATVPTTDEWWADMLVVDYGTGAIGAASADLFSNSGGNAGLQAKWLWYYSPERKLRLAFTDNVPSISDLTLLVGDVALALEGGDATFTWEDVDIDWEGGQTLTARIVRDWTSGVVALNSPATGLPTIIGTAQVGETLTADVSGVNDEDGLTNVSYSYQWVADDGNADTDIQDAADSTYTLTDDDASKAIKVRVSFTDDADHEETLTSAPTEAVEAKPNSPATGAPTIEGTAQVGETLTADVTGIADEDGLNNVSYSYQWISNDADIEGATKSTYTLTDSDEGKTIKVKVTFTDDADNEETLTSAATEVVQQASNAWSATMNVETRDGFTGYSFWGNPHLGSLSATEVEWDGKTHYVRFLFLKDGELRLGLNEEMFSTGFVLSVGDEEFGSAEAMVDHGGASYRFRWDDPGLGWSEGDEVTVNLVQSDQNTPALGAPTITGTAQVDETLTADTSGVEDADRLTNVSYSYQWMADGVDIQNATSSTYKLVFPDQGKTIKVKVSFTDDRDNEETLTSVATVAVAAAANREATGQPTISGTPQVGQTLTADTSNIADQDGLTNVSYSYQWIAGGTDIDGATGSSYELTSSEQGQTIQVRVTFTDDRDNEETLTSVATVAVAAAANREATGQPTISGTPQVGQTLTAATSAIDDEDGLEDAVFRYQWFASKSEVILALLGETSSTYTLAPVDAGYTFQVRVTFTDDEGNNESLTSEATEAVAATAPAAPQSLNVATGDQDQELEASWQAPSSNGGSAVTGYKVQWKEAADSWDTAADVSEAAETGTTYTITDLTGGVEYAVRVIATNDVGDGPASTEAKGTPAGGASEQVDEPENSAPTGLPGISGTPQVDQTLTADTSPIDDEDGLTNVSYSYQWIAGGTDIDGATGSTYTPANSDVGKTIQVRVTFTDDADNEETLTSEATVEVTAAPVPLTVSVTVSAPASHDGSSEFTFEIEFSEEVKLSYATLKNHAFNVTGGSVERAQRTDKPSNISWLITVKPQGNGDVTIELPATTDCDDQGAICTKDDSGRKLSNSLSFTVSGPGG